MATGKHSLAVLIVTAIGAWIVGVNIGARSAMASADCKPVLPPPTPNPKGHR